MGTLCQTADQLVSNHIAIPDAGRIAEEIVTGSVRNVGGIRSRVYQGTGQMQNELAELAAYLQKYSKEDPRRWAATLLMVHVQVAAGNLDAVVNLLRRVVNATGGICPPNAARFATAMVDALLVKSDFLPTEEIEWLQRVRRDFSGAKL